MYLITLFLLVINVILVQCAPTEQNISMYDQILANCSSGKALKDNTLLKPCENWSKIQKTTALNASTEQNVKCLLFYTSFINYCRKTENKVEDGAFKLQTGNLPKLDTICDKLTNLSSAHLKISLGKRCLRLCTSYEDADNGVDKTCLISYHFTNLTQNMQIIAAKPTTLASPVINNQENNNKKPPPPPVEAETGKIEQKPPAPSPKIEKVPNVAKSGHEVARPEEIVILTQKKTPVTTTQVVLNEKVDEPPPAPVEAAGKNDDGANVLVEEPVNVVEKNNNHVPLNNDDNVQQPEQQQQPQHQENPPNLPPDNVDNEETNDDEDEMDKSYVEQEKKPVEESVIAPQPPKEDFEMDRHNEPVHVRIDDINDGDSSFFSYFMVVSVLCVGFYVGYHNRQKIMALLLEGKRRRPYRGGRRPNSANYHKLDSNLEEAISSSCSKTTTNVIY